MQPLSSNLSKPTTWWKWRAQIRVSEGPQSSSLSSTEEARMYFSPLRDQLSSSSSSSVRTTGLALVMLKMTGLPTKSPCFFYKITIMSPAAELNPSWLHPWLETTCHHFFSAVPNGCLRSDHKNVACWTLLGWRYSTQPHSTSVKQLEFSASGSRRTRSGLKIGWWLQWEKNKKQNKTNESTIEWQNVTA